MLALFEGVATGAADGYARMAGRPAATLLHLGPGLGNGLANLHNARRARSPVVNIVGDHAISHRATTPRSSPTSRRSPATCPPSCAAAGHDRRRSGRDAVDASPPPRAARGGGHPDPAGRRLVVRGRGAGGTGGRARCGPAIGCAARPDVLDAAAAGAALRASRPPC